MQDKQVCASGGLREPQISRKDPCDEERDAIQGPAATPDMSVQAQASPLDCEGHGGNIDKKVQFNIGCCDNLSIVLVQSG